MIRVIEGETTYYGRNNGCGLAAWFCKDCGFNFSWNGELKFKFCPICGKKITELVIDDEKYESAFGEYISNKTGEKADNE